MEVVEAERRAWVRVIPAPGREEREVAVVTHDRVRVLIDALAPVGDVAIVALIQQAMEDVKPPHGVRNYVQDREHGVIDDTQSAGDDETLESGAHFLDQRD